VAPTAARRIGTIEDALPVPAGRVIVRQGEPASGVSVVTDGALLESAVDDDGRVLGLDVLGPGDAVGGMHGSPATADVRALIAARLRPVGPDRAGWLLDGRRQRLADLAVQLAWLGVTDRVASRLEDLAERFGRPTPGGTVVRLALTQEDLAALCGTSRESANRALRSLRDDGRVQILGRGRFLIPTLHAVPGSR
jgi:CRP/FNR family cyclic AMP-dependent transcriptional regulator